MAQLLWVRLSDYMDDFGIDPGGWLCDCAVIKSAHTVTYSVRDIIITKNKTGILKFTCFLVEIYIGQNISGKLCRGRGLLELWVIHPPYLSWILQLDWNGVKWSEEEEITNVTRSQANGGIVSLEERGSIRWVIHPTLLSWDNNRHAGSDNPQLATTLPQLKQKIYKAPSYSS